MELAYIRVIAMNLQDFKTEYRQAIEESLNQLQTAVLLMAQLEAQIAHVGQDLQNLSLRVEQFVTKDKVE